MTDRELLELAAKAVGMWKTDFCLDDDDLPCFDDARGFCLAWGKGWWNPLSDDGDALRLAVKLHVSVLSNETASWIAHGMGQMNIAEEFHDGTDPYAATRRAIVRAAAAIGKSMTIGANHD